MKNTLAAWTMQNLHRQIDIDKAFSSQCVDAVRSYLLSCHSLDYPVGNAAGLAGTRWSGVKWVPNGPLNFPPPGAIVVWSGSNDVGVDPTLGHCGVSVLADAYHLVTLDQNWDGHSSVELEVHSYSGVVGWHTFK